LRARNIKPKFFVTGDLVELPPLTRLLFIGLWCAADREGRLEDSPITIKFSVLPGDDCDVDKMLGELAKSGFIIRYETDETRYIQVKHFTKHQSPHSKEKASTIPAPDKHQTSTRQTPDKHALIADSGLLIADKRLAQKESPIRPSNGSTASNDSESAEQHASNNGSNGSKPSAFDAFWEVYPVKKGKKKAREAFKTACKETTAEAIVDAIRSQVDHLMREGPKFCPHPTTWLNQGRWEDEITPEKTALQKVDEYWGARDDES